MADPYRWSQLLDRADILILDTETTGFGAEDEIVDIAIIDTTGKVLYNELVMSTVPIHPGAVRAHEITHEFLNSSGANAWPSHHSAVANLLRQATCVLIYNESFDVRMLQQMAAKHRLNLPRFKTRCIMDEFVGGKTRKKLGDVARQLGVSTPQSHRALADVKTVLAVMRAAIR